MKFVIISLCLSLISFSSAKLFINPYPRLESHAGFPAEDFAGSDGPLLITPLLESGKDVKEIQKMAAIDLPDLKDFPGFSGFITVNKTTNSNMFFWYFPAASQSESSPVVLWLQGGPGASSLFGLFTENGPFEVTSSGKVKARKYSWNLNHNLLYIDNPVGTGFSFVDKDEGYAKNEVDVGNDLYSALLQFFTLFPNLQQNKFYVTGESYAGKYVPAISHTIHKRNGGAKLKINLQGLAIGNGFSDPLHQLEYGDYLYQLGLIDTNGRDQFHEFQKKGTDCIKKEDYDCAFEVFDELIDMDQHASSLFQNMTGFSTYFNYLEQQDDGADKPMANFLKRSDVRKAIHVGDLPFHGLDGDENKVEEHLKKDIMKSVTPYISELLSHYRVCIYNGQLDIIVAYPLTINYLKKLSFKDSDKYKKAPRYIWRVGTDIAGFVHEAGNLVEVLVRNAGHMVPHDQPKWAYDLITRFTHGKSLH